MNQGALAIEIGGSKLQIVRGDSAGCIQERFRFAVDAHRGADDIRSHIERTLSQVQAKHKLDAIGVGFGGPVDWRTGCVYTSHHVPGWAGFKLGDWLNSISGVPVAVDNDANVAALAEARLGAGRSGNPVFYVTLGSGVGGGLVVDDNIYHGATPGEAEIGHVRLERDGTTVESRCAGWAVDRRIRDAVKRQPSGCLAGLVHGRTGCEARYLKAAVEAGDETAVRILTQEAEDLAYGLSHVVHLLHPESIVLGGGLSLLGQPLRDAVAVALPRFVMDAFKPGPDVLLTALGEDAVPVGALLLAQRMQRCR